MAKGEHQSGEGSRGGDRTDRLAQREMHQEISLEGLRGRLVMDQSQLGQGEEYELRVRFNLTSRANIDNGTSNYRDR